VAPSCGSTLRRCAGVREVVGDSGPDPTESARFPRCRVRPGPIPALVSGTVQCGALVDAETVNPPHRDSCRSTTPPQVDERTLHRSAAEPNPSSWGASRCNLHTCGGRLELTRQYRRNRRRARRSDRDTALGCALYKPAILSRRFLVFSVRLPIRPARDRAHFWRPCLAEVALILQGAFYKSPARFRTPFRSALTESRRMGSRWGRITVR